jgi:negative regulator of replication initiation
MPNQPKTPLRNVRVDDQLWQASKAKAAEQGETVADVLRRALEAYTQQKAQR